MDMNIVPVYFELGIIGRDVNITVPDDGLEWTHPEILPRFVSLKYFCILIKKNNFILCKYYFLMNDREYCGL